MVFGLEFYLHTNINMCKLYTDYLPPVHFRLFIGLSRGELSIFQLVKSHNDMKGKQRKCWEWFRAFRIISCSCYAKFTAAEENYDTPCSSCGPFHYQFREGDLISKWLQLKVTQHSTQDSQQSRVSGYGCWLCTTYYLFSEGMTGNTNFTYVSLHKSIRIKLKNLNLFHVEGLVYHEIKGSTVWWFIGESRYRTNLRCCKISWCTSQFYSARNLLLSSCHTVSLVSTNLAIIVENWYSVEILLVWCCTFLKSGFAHNTRKFELINVKYKPLSSRSAFWMGWKRVTS